MSRAMSQGRFSAPDRETRAALFRIKEQLKETLRRLIHDEGLPEKITRQLNGADKALDGYDFHKAESILETTNNTLAAIGRETHTAAQLKALHNDFDNCAALIALQTEKLHALFGQ